VLPNLSQALQAQANTDKASMELHLPNQGHFPVRKKVLWTLPNGTLDEQLELVAGEGVVAVVVQPGVAGHQGVLGPDVQVVVDLPVHLPHLAGRVEESLHPPIVSCRAWQDAQRTCMSSRTLTCTSVRVKEWWRYVCVWGGGSARSCPKDVVIKLARVMLEQKPVIVMTRVLALDTVYDSEVNEGFHSAFARGQEEGGGGEGSPRQASKQVPRMLFQVCFPEKGGRS